jgi:signal transduction histidine kinase
VKTLHAKLWIRLTIAFAFIALVGVALVAILANRATSIGFARYLESGDIVRLEVLQDELGSFYAAGGSWNGVNSVLRGSGAGPQGGGGGYFLRVLDADRQEVGGRGGQTRSTAEFDAEFPISVDGQTVGYLLAEPAGQSGRAGEQYLASVNQAIIWAGLLAIITALILGIFLARRITRPISRLALATRAVAGGDFNQQVEVTSADEIGQLAEDFNHMAHTLALSERQRRQLLADTAHDLRTPISIIRSHLEAMLDGVFPLTQENLAAIHEETLHLSRLVEDVRILSLAETGHLPLTKKALNLQELAGQVVSSFAPLAELDGVRLISDLPEVRAVMADEARIRQVLANLISNALRFAPLGRQDPPTVTVSLLEEAGTVLISVADSGPGLTADQQQRVFDRFWRAAAARDRQSGSSGLGLAIAKSIVEAHNGQISVQSTPGEGTVFTIGLVMVDG